jgi:hypothetical protein
MVYLLLRLATTGSGTSGTTSCSSFSTPVSPTNNTNHHDITEILLKVALNTKNQTKPVSVINSDN